MLSDPSIRVPFHSLRLVHVPARLIAVSMAWLLAGCAATVDLSSGAKAKPAQAAAAQSSKQTAPSVAEEKAKAAKAQKQARELAMARLELQVTESEVQSTLADHDHALAQADQTVNEAQIALQRFRNVTRVHKLDEAQLEIDKAQTEVKENGQELAQMQAMYTAEANLDATGKQTRDLVLERHQRRIEFATRELELVKRAKQDLEEGEMAMTERKLQRALVHAQDARRKAGEEAERARIKTRIELENARGKIADLESGIEVSAAKEQEKAAKAGSGAKSKSSSEEGSGEDEDEDDGDEEDGDHRPQPRGSRP